MEIKVGDFIQCEVRPFTCGIVTKVVYVCKQKAYVIELATGEWDIIFDCNAVFIAR